MRRLSIPWLAACIITFLAIGLRIVDPPAVARLRVAIFDTYQRLLPRQADPAIPVRIVAVDEKSIEALGQWPWPRDRLAEIVTKLKAAGARSIVFDLILSEPDRLSANELAKLIGGRGRSQALIDDLAKLPSNDAQLAASFDAALVTIGVSGDTGTRGTIAQPTVGLSAAGDDPALFVPSFAGGVGTLPILAEKAEGIGAVNWLPSDDQIVRHVPLLVSIKGVLYPSLSLEALRIATGQTTVFVKSSGASGITAFGQASGIELIRVGDTILPADAEGQLWLHYAKPDPKRYVSASDVIANPPDKSLFEGRDVIIGAKAAGLLDIRATPLDAATPGVEIHAQALEQMLSGQHLVRPAWATGLELSFIALVGIVITALVTLFSPLAAAIAGSLAIAMLGFGSWNAYQIGTLIDPIYPSLAVVMAYIASSLPKYIETELERSRVRAAFSHYLAAPLVEELARNPDKLKLGGEMRELTVLFADVRGFTGLSEGMQAETLVRFMNDLFDPLADEITRHGGTIDKYIGDAVMAFWNAPLRDRDHARHACLAALAMITAVEQINERGSRDAQAKGDIFKPLRIGIGINTGDCCVGNLGSSRRFDYSALGEPVNVASRLETETKAFNIPIITGEATAKAARSLALVEIGQVTPRGATKLERVFALVGDEAVAASETFADLRKAHARLTAALHTGDQKTAKEALASCREFGLMNYPQLSGLWVHYAQTLGTFA